MVSKIIIVIICFIAVGCMGKHRAAGEAGYDEQSLKLLVQDVYKNNDADNKLDSVITAASADSLVFLKTISFLEQPFADPNSTYRNEELYCKLLKTKINSSWYDSAAKTKVRDQLYLVMQNHVGSAANDFIYVTTDGFKKKMYDVHADNTLLYFYNPECEACKEMKTSFIASTIISNKVASGKLKILAIFTDKDEKLWLDHLSEMPATWIQGRDENEYLYKNNVYDLKAIPTVYLLDKSKNVLLKDCMNVSLIEKQLSLY